jgi:hypothetical protein
MTMQISVNEFVAINHVLFIAVVGAFGGTMNYLSELLHILHGYANRPF